MIREIDTSFPLVDKTGDRLLDAVGSVLVNTLNEDDKAVDVEIEQELEGAIEITDDQALEIWTQNAASEEEEALLSSISSQLARNNEMWETTGMNCSAHTLQLAVKDALKAVKKKHQNVVTLARGVVKFLSLESTRNEMREREMKYNLPRIDCATRWGSTCVMVNIIHNFFRFTSNLRKQFFTHFVTVFALIFMIFFFLNILILIVDGRFELQRNH